MSAPKKLPSHDVLSKLARDDPEAFEELRRELNDDLINNAPERMQPRLRGIQFRVDAMRQLSKSPLGAAVRVYSLMWESFLEMNRELQALVRPPDTPHHGTQLRLVCSTTDDEVVEQMSEPQARLERSARVIEFRGRSIPG